MESELAPTLRYLARRQSGLVSRCQARQAGLSEDMIKFRVKSGRWRQIHPGVYATFTGQLSRRAPRNSSPGAWNSPHWTARARVAAGRCPPNG